jgi:hypothetical protein
MSYAYTRFGLFCMIWFIIITMLAILGVDTTLAIVLGLVATSLIHMCIAALDRP